MKEITCDELLTVISNKTRMKIMFALRKGNKNVSQLQSTLNINQTTLSHNLKKLKDYGFVSVKRSKKYRIYYLNREYIEPLIGLIENHIEKYCKNKVR